MRLIASLLLVVAALPAADPVPLTTEPTPASAATVLDEAALRQQVSRIAGKQMAEAIKQYNLDAALISDIIAGRVSASAPSEAEAQDIMAQWSEVMKASQAKEGQARQEKNVKWLAENSKKAGVTTTATGLQYEVLVAGKGDRPKITDTVSVNYRGTLLDGTEFDRNRGGPTEFPIANLIAGWQEALPLMPVGSKWLLTVPSELAYGENAPPNIGPHQILQFEMELLSIVK